MNTTHSFVEDLVAGDLGSSACLLPGRGDFGGISFAVVDLVALGSVSGFLFRIKIVTKSVDWEYDKAF